MPKRSQHTREVERWTLYFALARGRPVALVFIGFGGVVAALATLLAIKRQADLQERSIVDGSDRFYKGRRS